VIYCNIIESHVILKNSIFFQQNDTIIYRYFRYIVSLLMVGDTQHLALQWVFYKELYTIYVINVYNVYKKIFVNAFIILSTFISIKIT